MAIEKVIEINVKGKEAEKNLDAITQKIFEQRDITIEFEKELKRLEQQLRDTPKTALAAQRNLTQQMNHVKDAIADQNLTLKQLNFERQKVTAIQKATVSEEQFGRALGQTRGQATGLNMLIPGLGTKISGLTGIFNLASKGVGNFVRGLGVMKTAIIATGIGALVVALGAIVAYWDDIKGAVDGVSRAQKDLNKLAEKNLEIAKENLDAISSQENILRLQGKSEREILMLKRQATAEAIKEAKVRLEQEKNTRDAQLEAAKRNQDILKGVMLFVSAPLTAILFAIDQISRWAGKESDLLNQYQEWGASFIVDPKKIKEEGDAAIKEREKTLKDLENQEAGHQLSINKIDQDGHNKRKEQRNKAILKELQDREKLLQEIEKLENEYLTSQLDKQTQEENAVREKYFAIIEAARQHAKDMGATQEEQNEAARLLEEAQQAALQEITDRYDQERLDKLQSFRDKFIEQQELDLEQQREQALSELELLITTEEEKLQAIAEINEYYRQLQKDKDKEDLEDYKILQQAKIAVVSQTMGMMAEVIGKNSALGKAAASAQALIDTYGGINKVINTESTLPEPFATAQKIASIGTVSAIGFKAVKDINKTKIPGGGGSGASPTGSPDRSQAAFNLIGDRGGVSQIGDLGSQADPTPQKVYVTTGDVSTGQELDRNAVTQAGF